MGTGFLYLDSSALVKLILPEAESEPLIRLLADWEDRVSSALAAVEVTRAVARASNNEIVKWRARRVLDGVHLVALDDEVLELAAEIGPSGLRSLDAIHLASARALEPDLGAMVCYDMRLAEAASGEGFEVLAPA